VPSIWAFQHAYPMNAMRAGIEGHVVIRCAVAAGGTVRDCVVLSEEPQGQGFGDAALHLSTLFRMKPMTRDGRPVDGGIITVPIGFRLAGAVHARPSDGGDTASPTPPAR